MVRTFYINLSLSRVQRKINRRRIPTPSNGWYSRTNFLNLTAVLFLFAREFSYKVSGDDKSIATMLMNSYLEQELNTYDVACAAYIDNKIDRKRFKKTYSTEIQNLFEKGQATKELLDKHGRYYAIKKVYEEWFNPEK